MWIWGQYQNFNNFGNNWKQATTSISNNNVDYRSHHCSASTILDISPHTPRDSGPFPCPYLLPCVLIVELSALLTVRGGGRGDDSSPRSPPRTVSSATKAPMPLPPASNNRERRPLGHKRSKVFLFTVLGRALNILFFGQTVYAIQT